MVRVQDCRTTRPNGLGPVEVMVGNTRFDPKHLGRYGEDLALEHYVQQGYGLVARNWRCSAGELDLILAKGAMVVFAEVKTRSSTRHGTPFEAVDRRKQRRIRRLAAIWLATNPVAGSRPVRFDVVSVIGTRVEIREQAF